jgi:hypothetical protein
MQAFLSKIMGSFSRPQAEEEAAPDSRLGNIVARQRGLVAASVQERLSRQQTDPHSEEATNPLYSASVYSSAPAASED